MIVFKRAWPAMAALAWPLWPAWAQTPPSSTDNAELREAHQRWSDANERVGRFPRGHADLLQWERKNLPPGATSSLADTPLAADEAVRRSLALKPGLFGPEAPNPLLARERHLALLTHIARVRQAWLDAVWAAQALKLQQDRSEVADSGSELGRRMVQAGNWSQARLLREQVTQAREGLALLRARQAERSARERLARELGLGQANDVAGLARRLPAELPEPPADLEPLATDALEARVLAADTALAQQRQATARRLEALPAGRLRQHAQALTDSLAALPAEGLPPAALVITDARIARDHTLREAAEADASLALAEATRRSQAREAWGRLQDQHALARQAQAVLLPLVSAQEQETQLRYNGMLQSTWDLLEATRERLAATSTAAQARHAYWTAWLDWQLLLAGGAHRATGSTALPAQAGTAPKEH